MFLWLMEQALPKKGRNCPKRNNLPCFGGAAAVRGGDGDLEEHGVGMFPPGVGLFPPFCAPYSPKTSGLRIAPVPAPIYGQRRFLAGRLLPRRGGGAGLRRKQGRSSFIFLCFASRLSRFLRRPHPWNEGLVASAPGPASPPLQQPVSVFISYFSQKTQIFLVFCLCQPFSQPTTLQHEASGCPWNAGTRLSVPFPPGKMLLGCLFPACPGGEQSPFLHPNGFFSAFFFWTTLVSDLF